jgi:urease accessory protein
MSEAAGWLGRLALVFERTEHGTQLSHNEHQGPLRIQRVLTPEGLSCPHVYLLHPPGGVVGGDRLQTRVKLGARAQALLTTPAAQKLYRSAGATAEIVNQLELDADAALEWLPSETLAFSAALASITTRVVLARGAAFLGWDVACYGMPARNEPFERGRVVTRFEIFREQAPLLVESFDLQQGEGLLSSAFGLRGFPVVATLFGVPASGSVPSALLEQVREAVGEGATDLRSVSSLQELLVVRVLAPNVEAARAPLLRAWQLLRPALLARPPVPPRIWAT